MTWLGWVVIGLQVFGTLSAIALIGKPRDPYTPKGAVVSVVLCTLLVVGILTIGTGTGL